MNYSQLKKELTKMKNDNKVSRKEMIRQLLHAPALTMENVMCLLTNTSKYDKMPLSQLKLEYEKAVKQYPHITEPDKPVTHEYIMELLSKRPLTTEELKKVKAEERKKDAGN